MPERAEQNVYNNLTLLKGLFKKAHMNIVFFIVPLLLTVAVSVFEAISLALLMPLIRGILTLDFTFISETPVLNVLFNIILGSSKRTNSTILFTLLMLVFAAVVAKNVLQYLSTVGLSYQLRRFSNNLRKELFSCYLNMNMKFFDSTSRGYLQNIILDFTNSLVQQLMQLNMVVLWFFMLIAYMIIMMVISVHLTVFAILILPGLFFAVGWVIEKIKKSSLNRAVILNNVSRKIYNTLSCILLVKLYTTEEKEKREFAGVSDRMEQVEFSIDKKINFILPAQDILTFIIALILIAATAFIVTHGKAVEISKFLIFFYAIKKSANNISAINQCRGAIAIAAGPAAKLLEFFDNEHLYAMKDGTKEFTGLQKSIEFRDLTFSYKGDVHVLEHINLSIEKNKVTALVGPTGSGKTTVCNLILRLYDSPRSAIQIDGVDIDEYTLRSLRSQIAVVSQDMMLFNDTLRNNIVYGVDRPVTDEELTEVAKKAKLYDFIMKLPDRFNTNIGDRGLQLSGGEKQRVSIARALLKGAGILILDEATSALDTATEKLIHEAITEVMKNKTVIVIAHRLSTVRDSDTIIVIEHGKVAEKGPLDKLLAKKGKFYEYWEAQKFY